MSVVLQYCYWRQQLGDGVGRSILDFYKDPIIRSWYKFYVSSLVLRNNTITGVLYRDDPTILAWELINEPSAPADDTGQTVAVIISPCILNCGASRKRPFENTSCKRFSTLLLRTLWYGLIR